MCDDSKVGVVSKAINQMEVAIIITYHNST